MGNNKEGFSGFGMSGEKIRRMQEKVSEEVEERKAETERLLAESRKARDFRKSSEYAGMSKGDLTRSSRAKKK